MRRLARCAIRARTTSRRCRSRPGRSTTTRSATSYERYGRLYEEFYGYRLDGIPIELVRLAVVATGETASLSPSARRAAGRPTAVRRRRDVFFPAAGFVRRDDRAPRGARAGRRRGRARSIVESMDSTVVVPPGWAAA